MMLVVGDVITDVIVRPSGPLISGSDCPSEIRPSPGGAGANQACWLAHLGAAVAFAGRVGAADLAAQTAAFHAAGVRAHLGADAHRPTGMIVAIIAPDGERSFYTDRGANQHLSAADLPSTLLDDARWLHVSGYALFEPGPRAAAMALMAAARSRGLGVSVDGGSSAFLRHAGADAFGAWTGAAAICFSNADEAAVLGEAAYPVRVITAGPDGASALAGGEWVRVPARPVAAHDTTGAGDAFLAGFLVAHLAGADLAAALTRGTQAGTVAVGLAGGRPRAD